MQISTSRHKSYSTGKQNANSAVWFFSLRTSWATSRQNLTGCVGGTGYRCLPLSEHWVTSPGCPAIVGSMSHLSVPDEFVLHSLMSQPCASTTGSRLLLRARLCVDHHTPKPPDTHWGASQGKWGQVPKNRRSLPNLYFHPSLLVPLTCYSTEIKTILHDQQCGDLLSWMDDTWL